VSRRATRAPFTRICGSEQLLISPTEAWSASTPCLAGGRNSRSEIGVSQARATRSWSVSRPKPNVSTSGHRSLSRSECPSKLSRSDPWADENAQDARPKRVDVFRVWGGGLVPVGSNACRNHRDQQQVNVPGSLDLLRRCAVATCGGRLLVSTLNYFPVRIGPSAGRVCAVRPVVVGPECIVFVDGRSHRA
jgi:hypothetical protein